MSKNSKANGTWLLGQIPGGVPIPEPEPADPVEAMKLKVDVAVGALKAIAQNNKEAQVIRSRWPTDEKMVRIVKRTFATLDASYPSFLN